MFSGCVSQKPYEPLQANRPITEQEYKSRLKANAGKTHKEKPLEPFPVNSFGFEWPDAGYDSPFPFD